MTARPIHSAHPTSLVWLDSREAYIVHPEVARIIVAHLVSDVPPRRRSLGHVRHDPEIRHGGGTAQDVAARRRNARLEGFVEAVATRVPRDEDVIVLGPGSARMRLARRLGEAAGRRRSARLVTSRRAPRSTVPQLIAHLRQATEAQLPRRAPRRRGWLSRGGRSASIPNEG